MENCLETLACVSFFVVPMIRHFENDRVRLIAYDELQMHSSRWSLECRRLTAETRRILFQTTELRVMAAKLSPKGGHERSTAQNDRGQGHISGEGRIDYYQMRSFTRFCAGEHELEEIRTESGMADCKNHKSQSLSDAGFVATVMPADS
jgi:hypothetical protein